MKTKNNLFKVPVLLLILTLAGITTTFAQPSKSENNIKNLIESKHFVFKAQTVMPLSGRTRQLTSNYDMKVMGDSLITYLPYFGRAYTAPLDPTEGGIQFTSTNYKYTVKEKKKGWDITLTPTDEQNVRELLLNVSNSGYATLTVNSNNRQSISFHGYVTGR